MKRCQSNSQGNFERILIKGKTLGLFPSSLRIFTFRNQEKSLFFLPSFLKTSQTFFLHCFPTFNTLFLTRSQKLLILARGLQCDSKHFLSFQAAMQRLSSSSSSFSAFISFFCKKVGLLGFSFILNFYFSSLLICFRIRMFLLFYLPEIAIFACHDSSDYSCRSFNVV